MYKHTLKRAAESILEKSYCRYSGIKVACAIMGQSGKIYKGVNVENSSYGLSVCAERNAIAAGIAGGEKIFSEMVVVTNSELVKSPCGSCRQVLKEFCDDLTIYFYGPFKFEAKYFLSDLLPVEFTLKEEE